MTSNHRETTIVNDHEFPVDLIDIQNGEAFDEKSTVADSSTAGFYAEDEGPQPNFPGIVGRSAALRRALELIEMVAPTDSTVLLLGETGTGKELIARAIHERSRRKNRALVKVNCAAIPSGLLESELFGHERGAFTGAISQKLGRFELADQGSLFLDEVGDLPLELQPKLLRVLQEREIEKLGGVRTKKVDVRVIAATHRCLEELVAEKQFRSDLYYRLDVFPISIPSLRERPEDIPMLARHFASQFAERMNKTVREISAQALEMLAEHAWPGNIRELQNVMERAVVLHDHDRGKLTIERSWLSREPRRTESMAARQPVVSRIGMTDRDIIGAALAETKGRVSGPRGAAIKLGVPASTLESKIKSLQIDKHSFRFPVWASR